MSNTLNKPSDLSNPYYAYVRLIIGSLRINNLDNGVISLQAKYRDNAFCEYVVQLYDDTAHKVAEAIMQYGNKIRIRYGYVEGESSYVGIDCVIKNIHTELQGTGEILTLEMIPGSLSEVMESVAHDSVSYYEGSPSEILRQVLSEIGWKEGNITETKNLKGDNNGNDDLYDPHNYVYWGANIPITEFLEELKKSAITEDGKGNFIVDVDYSSKPPVVNFYPASDADKAGRQIDITYGKADSEVVSINVDWGMALLAEVGAKGQYTETTDSIDNTIMSSEDVSGHLSEDRLPAIRQVSNKPITQSELYNKGSIRGPQGEERFTTSLNMSSPEFRRFRNMHPEANDWKVEYNKDGVLTFGGYVVLSGDLSGDYSAEDGKPAIVDHVGNRNFGDEVQTSMGTGIILGKSRSAAEQSGRDLYELEVSNSDQYGWYAEKGSGVEQYDNVGIEEIEEIPSSSAPTDLLYAEEKQKLIASKKAMSRERFEVEVTNYAEKLRESAYEATLVVKGNFRIRLWDNINLTVYCKDGSIHFVSGKYRVLEKTDSIEGDFTTTLKVLKISNETRGSLIKDISYAGGGSGLYHSGVSSGMVTQGVSVSPTYGVGVGYDVVRYAKQFVGCPYVWGGTDPLNGGADCSGFVCYVYKNFGYDLPHYSGGLRNVGMSVGTSYSDLRYAMPGDILCYPGHAAIYQGNGMTVEAMGSKWGIVERQSRKDIVAIRRLV